MFTHKTLFETITLGDYHITRLDCGRAVAYIVDLRQKKKMLSWSIALAEYLRI